MSARENLTLGRPEASEAEIEEALHVARAEFVYDLPWGLETRLGEQGLSLTGGSGVFLLTSAGLALDVTANVNLVGLGSVPFSLGSGLTVRLQINTGPAAVSTTLGLVQVLLWQTDEQTWRIMPRSSFAVYTAQWLMDAMTEFASQEVA